jgi:TfoX/Sxy family transcriptional regulator of competence genes
MTLSDDGRMEFETDLAPIVRTAVKGAGAIREIKMFGGIGFMLNGNLVAAASKRGLLARVGQDQQSAALQQLGVRPMVMKGRTMQGYIYLDPPYISAPAVRMLLKLAIRFVRALEPKTPRRTPKLAKKSRKSKVARPVKRRANSK